MLENPNFEQDFWSRTAISVNKTGHDSMILMKRICYYDQFYYETDYTYDLMGSIIKFKQT